MATTTTNNGWTIPQSTDLVTNGATAIATLGNNIDASVGTGLKAWIAFTPTLTGWTAGNGTWDSYYVQLGKIVVWRMVFTGGTTTSFAGSPTFTVPVTSKTSTVRSSPFLVQLGAATNASAGVGYFASTTTVSMVAQNAAGTYLTNATISATVPNTWASGNTLSFTVTYEAA